MTLTPGIRLGPYEILSPLSVAGPGETYRARDHERGRAVVIRVLRLGPGADPELLPRLAEDVLEAGALMHPAVPKVYEVGTTTDTLYIVSEPFDGETLRTLVDRGALTTDAAAACLAEVASALAVAEQHRITHGNLRAENVLLTSEGRTVVLGFGLAAMDGGSQSDETAFYALRRDLLPEKPPGGSALPWWRRPAMVVAVGLLVLAIGIAVTAMRTVQRAGQSPLASGRAADDGLTSDDAAAGMDEALPAQVIEEIAVDAVPEPIPRVAEAEVAEAEIQAETDALPEAATDQREPLPAVAPDPPQLVSEAVTNPPGPAPEVGNESPEPVSEVVTNPLDATSGEALEQSADADSALPGSGGDEPLPLADDARLLAPPPAPSLPDAAATAPPATPAPGADGRDARSLVAEAIVRAAEFDLPGAMELLGVTATRGDAGSEVGLIYLRGLVDAREAFEQGGTVEALAPVYGAIETLATLSQGRRGSAEIARLVLQAAAAAAQSERDEMRLYLETAIQMELIQGAAGLPGAPLLSATEIAGDLWLRVDRYEDARQMYDDAADRVGPSLRNMLGSARASRRLKDVLAACTSYGGLLETWGSRPGAPPEIVEARTYIDTVCMSAEPPDVEAPG